jgi:hypothetical protein
VTPVADLEVAAGDPTGAEVRLRGPEQRRPRCGVAIEVPFSSAYWLLRIDERTLTPGAATLGFSRPLPSMVIGPRELKAASASAQSMAPTVKTASWSPRGARIVEHCGPAFCAAPTVSWPAARMFSNACWREKGSHPSLGGQLQELLVMSGARSGRPSLKGSPPRG